MVGNGRALIDLAPAGRGACDVEKRTNQLRLPCVAMSNDRKVANGFGGIDFHKCVWVLSEIEFRRQSSLRFSINEKGKCDCGLSDNLAEPKHEWQVRAPVRQEFVGQSEGLLLLLIHPLLYLGGCERPFAAST